MTAKRTPTRRRPRVVSTTLRLSILRRDSNGTPTNSHLTTVDGRHFGCANPFSRHFPDVWNRLAAPTVQSAFFRFLVARPGDLKRSHLSSRWVVSTAHGYSISPAAGQLLARLGVKEGDPVAWTVRA